jgi:hypothetical protein
MRKTISAFLLAVSLIMATWSNRSYARQNQGDNPGDGYLLPEVVVGCEFKGSHTFQVTFGNVSYSFCIQIWECTYGWETNFC